MKRNRKKLVCYILAGMAFSLLVLLGGQYGRRLYLQKSIADKVLRFHVLANSNTAEDQELKLKVRDAVGAQMGELLADAGNRAECEQIVEREMDAIVETAEDVIRAEGYPYGVQAVLGEVAFPVKTYGNYTFPAGDYEALEVVIGEGAGRNWWCVMYPNMCFSGSVYEVVDENSEEALREVLSPEEYEQVFSSGNYEVQFQYLPFLNELVE